MTGKTKGCKVFTTVREFEIEDDFAEFSSRLKSAHSHDDKTINGLMQDSPITFNIENIVAVIPMIDLGF